MADAVSNVIRTAVQIRRMCERAKACRALVDVVERKMASLIPVMAEIQDHLEEMDTTAVMHLTTALAKDIRECRAIVQRASQMSKISYIVHSNDLREQIERNLRAIHLALMSLQASQNTYLIHQNQRLADEFRKFHSAWQQREKELRREKERESRLKARVAKSLEECNQRGASDEVRRESVAKAAGIRVSQAKWLEKELARARADHDRLVVKMKRDKDTVARSKAKADAMLMDQIITALAISESINISSSLGGPSPSPSAPLPPEANHTSTSRRDLPEDCFCPITNQVMEDPIIVDAPCHHTLSRQAARQWYGMGKTTCPVCGIEVTSHHLSPNVQVRNITESLISDGVYRYNERDRPKHNNDVVVTVDSDIIKTPIQQYTSGPVLFFKPRSVTHERSECEKYLSRKWFLLIIVVTLFVGSVVGLVLGLKPEPVPPEDLENDSFSEELDERAQVNIQNDENNEESFVNMVCGGVGDRAIQCGASDWASLKFCCDGLICDNVTNICTDELEVVEIDEDDYFLFDMKVICEDGDEVCQNKRLEGDRNFVSLPAGVYDKNNCPGEADLFDKGDKLHYTWTFYEMVTDPFVLAIDIFGCRNSTKRVFMRMYTFDDSRAAPEFDCIKSTYSTCGEPPGRGDPPGLGDLTAVFRLTGSNQYLFVGTTGTPLPWNEINGNI